MRVFRRTRPERVRTPVPRHERRHAGAIDSMRADVVARARISPPR